MREARATAEFRGTCRYASIQSHMHEELGRRDDLWSLLYMLLELHGGQLPWNATRDHDEVLKLKRQHLLELLHARPNDDGNVHTAGVFLPGHFIDIVRHLNGLGFADEPDYAFVHQGLLALLPIGASRRLDWAAEVAQRTPTPYSHAARCGQLCPSCSAAPDGAPLLYTNPRSPTAVRVAGHIA